MITIDELKMQMGDHRQATAELGDALAITASEKRVAELEHKMTMPGSSAPSPPATSRRASQAPARCSAR